MRRIHRSIRFLIILILLFIVCSTSIFYNFFYEEYNIKKFVTEWFTDDKKIQTSYQNAILTGTYDSILEDRLENYFTNFKIYKSFRNAFEYIPIRILQKYDSYYITKVIVTKEKNGYLATAFLKLKNGDITVTHKIEMKFQTDINSKKINYFTVIDGQNIE